MKKRCDQGKGVEWNVLKCVKRLDEVAATIAPWFRLRLPSCGTRFESQAPHIGMRKRQKETKKKPGLSHIKRLHEKTGQNLV